MSNIARAKADKILSSFDSLRSDRLLYSISNEQYLVVLKGKCHYQQYYIHTDTTGKIIERKKIKTSNKDKEALSKAFDFNDYRKDFVTRVNKPKVVQGNQSYFVVKDTNGERYGEYWLSAITVPIPIDKKLYSYLFGRLLSEASSFVQDR